MKSNKIFQRNILFAALLVALYLIDIAVLSPIYTYVCSDVILLESSLPMILEILMDICRLLIWCHFFSFIIASIYLYGAAKSKFLFIFSPIVIFLRYFGTLVFSATVDNIAIGSEDFGFAFLNFIFDAFQILTIAVITHLLTYGNEKKTEEFFPFGKIHRPESRLRLSIGIGAILIAIVRVIMRIVFDVGYGAPESFDEIILMAMYYISDLMYGFLSYLIVFISVKLMCKNKASD